MMAAGSAAIDGHGGRVKEGRKMWVAQYGLWRQWKGEGVRGSERGREREERGERKVAKDYYGKYVRNEVKGDGSREPRRSHGE